MKLPIYLGATAAAITVLGIGLISTNQPISAPAAGFLGWAVSPYLGLMLLIRTARQKVSMITIAILTAAIAGFGIWIYVDSMFDQFKKDVRRFQADPQYAQGWSDGFRQCETEQEALERQTRMSIEQQRLTEERKHDKWEEKRHLETEALKGIDTRGLENL